ncbi:MAG: hypothetical protein OEL83_17865 [Desulforhopalus sp.]|nr:hypothetical protein [Desulforhopalus sp.]
MMKNLLSLFFVLILAGTAFADENKVNIPIGNSPTFGPANAPVTIIEFIDFQ